LQEQQDRGEISDAEFWAKTAGNVGTSGALLYAAAVTGGAAAGAASGGAAALGAGSVAQTLTGLAGGGAAAGLTYQAISDVSEIGILGTKSGEDFNIWDYPRAAMYGAAGAVFLGGAAAYSSSRGIAPRFLGPSQWGPARGLEAVGRRSFGEGRTAGERIVNNQKLFKNLALADQLAPPKLLDYYKIRSQKISGEYNYVVTKEGKLIIGRKGGFPGGGHIDLAQGKPVRSAGQVRFVNGNIKYINNKSGHYQPRGVSAKNAALEAFNIKDVGLYRELYK
jgi:hypothetical protein